MIGRCRQKAHAHVPTGVDLDALVAEANTGGRRLGGERSAWALSLPRRGLVAVSTVVRLATRLLARVRRIQRCRGARHPSGVRAGAGLCRLSSLQSSAQSGAGHRLAVGATGVACVLYLLVFDNDLAMRPGLPTRADIIAAVVGVLIYRGFAPGRRPGCRSLR